VSGSGTSEKGQLKMKKMKKAAGRHNCVENGSESEGRDTDKGDSEGGMDVSQEGEKKRDKRGNTFAGSSTKRARSNEDYGKVKKIKVRKD